MPYKINLKVQNKHCNDKHENYINYNYMLNLDIREIPDHPGVYIFVGDYGKILYVGKAKSLKKRVQSYYNNQNQLDLKKTAMLGAARDIKFIVTKNEVEAFLLEANLIKNEKPRYNVMLKDSKGYPYIKLTGETFPKLQYTRDTIDNKATCFGPFIDAHGLKGLLMDLQRIFPLRTCSNNRLNQKKLCLKYQIKECCGPCENKVTGEEYAILVKQVKEFFKGNISSVKGELLNKMKVFVDKLQFEEAARIRDKINTLDGLFTEQSVIYRGRKKSIDAFIFHNKIHENVLQVLWLSFASNSKNLNGIGAILYTPGKHTLFKILKTFI